VQVASRGDARAGQRARTGGAKKKGPDGFTRSAASKPIFVSCGYFLSKLVLRRNVDLRKTIGSRNKAEQSIEP
jgi:hypothetical protein